MQVAIPQALPAAIGELCEGGIFAGRIRVNKDVYGLVVSPKGDGEHDGMAWNKTLKIVSDAVDYSNGLANTKAMATAGSKLALWAQDLRIAGFDDWYLPSRDELELLYRHFKPGTGENWTFRSGDNPSSLPPGYPYTSKSPGQTTVEGFDAGGINAFEEACYWSSTQYASYPDYAWFQGFGGGGQDGNRKDSEFRARAVRRFKI